MLKLTIAEGDELWDEVHQEFIIPKRQTIELEHSLVSISKWESKWQKPFLLKERKSEEENLDYIYCMILTRGVDPKILRHLSSENVAQINKYIDAPMTATTFGKEQHKSRNSEVLTAEVIYYYMIALGIPFECQKWHLNKLLTLIKVCNIKSQPPKKMSKRDVMSRNASLNAARRAQMNSRG